MEDGEDLGKLFEKADVDALLTELEAESVPKEIVDALMFGAMVTRPRALVLVQGAFVAGVLFARGKCKLQKDQGDAPR